MYKCRKTTRKFTRYKMNDGNNSWELKGMLTAEEETTFGIIGKLRKMQRVCKIGGEAMPTANVEVIKCAREED